MKLLSYGILLALVVCFSRPITAQIPIPRYLRELPGEEAIVLQKEHNSTRAKVIKAAGIRSKKEYKTKPEGEKRLVNEYFFDKEGRFSRVEVYSPQGIMG